VAQCRAYVADLAAYNSGQLIGQWVDLDGLDADDMKAAVQAVIDASPFPGAEEYAIHDWDGVPTSFGEWPDWELVAAYVEAATELDEADLQAFNIWRDNVPGYNNELQAFRDEYRGCYDSGAEYAEQLADDLGIPFPAGWPFSCIDWDSAWREVELGGDCWSERGSFGLHVFANA
jgi:antirestriction protein